MLFNALDLVTLDEAGTNWLKEQSAQTAANIKAQKVGEMVLAGVSLDEATALAEDAASVYRQHYARYDIDGDDVYPVVLEWLAVNHGALAQYAQMSDSALTDKAIDEQDVVARLVLKARQIVNEALVIQTDEDVELASVPGGAGLSDDDAQRRNTILEAARRFFIQVLMIQSGDKAINDHWLNRPNWRLNAVTV